ANVKAEVVCADVPFDLSRDPSQYGHGLIGLGKVTMHGAVKSDTFVRLAAEPHAGDTTLLLEAPVSGWQVGDRLVLPDTHQLQWFEQHLYDYNYLPQWELPALAAISADGRTITLAAPLQFDHLGSRNPDGALEFLPHVGVLSRNVVVKSANPLGTRGHTMFLDRADVDVRYVQFSGLGRTQVGGTDDTTYDEAGNVTHLGSNQSGRYPVQFLHLYGPAATPADGYQYTFVGNAVLCPVTPMAFKWGIDVNDSHYGLIKDNVLYNWAGAGVVTEAGNESYNVFEHNFVVRVLGDGARDGEGIL